jgi:hypothetical protein
MEKQPADYSGEMDYGTPGFPNFYMQPDGPNANEPMNAPSHAGQHANENDAVYAVETFVCTTASPNFIPSPKRAQPRG